MKLEITSTNSNIKITMPDGSIALEQHYDNYSFVLDLEAVINNIPTIMALIEKAVATAEGKIREHMETDGNVIFPGCFKKEREPMIREVVPVTGEPDLFYDKLNDEFGFGTKDEDIVWGFNGTVAARDAQIAYAEEL